MNKLLTLLLVLCVGGVALAEEVDYGWEDGGTILNAYPNPGSVIATNVNNWTEGENVETGNFAVKLELNEMGEAQGYLVYVWNLSDGDEVTVSFSRYTEEGGATVLIGGMPAARMGDMTAHGGTIVLGCPTVLIGP